MKALLLVGKKFSVPPAPIIYAVVPIYNQLSELNEVRVQWEEVVSYAT